jgi:hypothetical protein
VWRYTAVSVGITSCERGQNVTGVSAMVDSAFCITSVHFSSKRTVGKNLTRSITRYCFLLSGETFFGYQDMHYFIAVVNATLGWEVVSVVGDHGGHT